MKTPFRAVTRTAGRRLAAIGLTMGMVGLAVVTPTAAATAAPTVGTYLALGDSVAFGYVPAQAVPPPDYPDAASFVGYPEDLARALRLHVVNASCPGETTISMIAAGGLSNGCENAPGSTVGYRTLFPLHTSYSGTQLAFAEQFLRTHQKTSLVTIDIGANDGFICQEVTADHCTSPSELLAVLSQIRQNLKVIYQGIRLVAGYHGPLVALSYYSTDYNNGLLDLQSEAINAAVASVTHQFGGVVASGYNAFKAASASSDHNPCTAGLLIPIPGAVCNVHPSPAGHLVLASVLARTIARSTPGT